MKSIEMCGCLTQQIITWCDSFWCLVDEPEECPYSLHFEGSFTCIHPDRCEFAIKSAESGNEPIISFLKH